MDHVTNTIIQLLGESEALSSCVSVCLLARFLYFLFLPRWFNVVIVVLLWFRSFLEYGLGL